MRDKSKHSLIQVTRKIFLPFLQQIPSKLSNTRNRKKYVESSHENFEVIIIRGVASDDNIIVIAYYLHRNA